MKKYSKYLLVTVVAVFSLSLAVPSAGAVTIAELMAQIQALQAQLAQLQAQQGTTTAWCHDFNTNLRVGDNGSEIDDLNGALVKEGLLETGTFEHSSNFQATFSEETASAVSEFQEKYANEILTPYRLKRGTGFVGKSTRAKLNKLYGCGVATPTPVPIISFTANNVSDTLNIVENTSVTLSWSASNADSCSSSGGTAGWVAASRPTSGSAEPANSSQVSATYTLTCQNSFGIGTSKSIRINVKEQSTTTTPAPTVSLTAAKYSGFSDQAMDAGVSNVKIGSFTLSAGSTEGVNINAINVSLSSPENSYASVRNLALKNNSTSVMIGWTKAVPSAENTFSLNEVIVIQASETKVIDLYADILSGSSGNVRAMVSATGVGRITANSVSTNSAPLQAITFGSVSTAPAPTLLGDVNLDGKVDVGDVTIITRQIQGLDNPNMKSLANADLNGDGKITDIDRLIVAKVNLGTIQQSALPQKATTLCDVNLDGKVNISDVTIINSQVQGSDNPNMKNFSNADYDKDGKIMDADSTACSKVSNSTITTQPLFVLATTGGTVKSDISNASCGPNQNCNYNYTTGFLASLVATPATGYTFTGWSGAACEGTTGGTNVVCKVSMTSSKSVTAMFATAPAPTAVSPTTYTLSVTKSGSGSGTVKTNADTKIDCGSTCSASFGAGLSAFLVATPATGSSFTGWSGDACMGTTGGTNATCMVSMTANKSVTATFTTITITPTATTPAATTGALSFSQSSFSATYTQGSPLPSTSSDSPNLYTNTSYYQTSTFTNTSNVNVNYMISVPNQPTWLNTGYYTTGQVTAIPGQTTGLGAYLNPATVAATPGTYTTNIIITGNFSGSPKTIPVTLTVIAPTTYTLSVTKSGSGSGTVKTNADTKIDCGSTCSASFGAGLSAFLVATPATGSTFAGWSGDACMGTTGGTNATCMVSMTANKSVTATFTTTTTTNTTTAAAPVISYISPTSARAGSSIYVTGSNFDIDSNILLDGTISIPPVSQTSTTLIFNPPSYISVGSHSVQVKAMRSGLLSNSVSLNIVVSTTATPALTAAILDSVKAQLDLIQKAINDWGR